MYRAFVYRVDVCLGRWHRHLDRVLSFVRLGNAQVRPNSVITIRAPRNIAI